MPNEKENKYIISSEQEAKEKAQAAMQAQALARARNRLKKKTDSSKLSKEDILYFYRPEAIKKHIKISLTEGHIISLITLAILVDLTQFAIALLDFTRGALYVTDIIAGLASKLPFIGTVIYVGYQAVKISVVITIWVTKIALNIASFFIGKVIAWSIWMDANVKFLTRIKAKITAAILVRIMVTIFEFLIPIFPGFTVLMVMQILSVRRQMKKQIKQHNKKLPHKDS